MRPSAVSIRIAIAGTCLNCFHRLHTLGMCQADDERVKLMERANNLPASHRMCGCDHSVSVADRHARVPRPLDVARLEARLLDDEDALGRDGP